MNYQGLVRLLIPRHCHLTPTKRLCSSRAQYQNKNFYKVLNVDPKADAKAIKSAFYEQSKKIHPDTRPDDDKAPDEFRDLVEAYEILSDPDKRKSYDNFIGIGDKAVHDKGAFRGMRPRRQQYGVDPAVMRNIKVDLSEERMQAAWKAYKERWAREAEYFRNLEENKMIFRMDLDRKRSAYEHMSEDEKAAFKEGMRLFRHPKFTQNPPQYWTANENPATGDQRGAKGSKPDPEFEELKERMRKTNDTTWAGRGPNVVFDFEELKTAKQKSNSNENTAHASTSDEHKTRNKKSNHEETTRSSTMNSEFEELKRRKQQANQEPAYEDPVEKARQDMYRNAPKDEDDVIFDDVREMEFEQDNVFKHRKSSEGYGNQEFMEEVYNRSQRVKAKVAEQASEMKGSNEDLKKDWKVVVFCVILITTSLTANHFISKTSEDNYVFLKKLKEDRAKEEMMASKS